MSPGVIFGGGLGLTLAVVLADRAWSARGLAEEWAPAMTGPYLGRSLWLAVASVLLVVGARRWIESALPGRGVAQSSLQLPAALGGVSMAMVSVVLLLSDPESLTTLASEDHLVEWASALFCFAAGVLSALAARRYWNRSPGDRDGRLTAIGLLLIAGGFVLLGLEEVSWFQRVLDIESPEVFINRNRQGETNLHNLATTATGNGYYVGGFALCVLAPTLLADRRLPERWRWIQPLVPAPTVLFASAVSGAIVYEMWNVIWIQMIFWMTLPAVWLVADRNGRRPIGALVLAAMVVTAVAFLTYGDAMVRTWDDTEIRELVIPYGFVLYSAVVWRNAPTATAAGDRRG